jgi:hypothetical protein
MDRHRQCAEGGKENAVLAVVASHARAKNACQLARTAQYIPALLN